jgi:2-polyprenyl-3-methyl-5-hydroxy-6-metoxy-1,4-benzoquinol methylase
MVMVCRKCPFRLLEQNGVWQALPKERQRYYAQFVSDYEQIRRAEGRGSDSSDYYLALPYRDLSGQNQSQWSIRARTFRYLSKWILPQLKTSARPNPRVLDVGAGNGWLSHRLASMGFRPVAIDLLINDRDGLGAAKHFINHLPTMFPRIQAESTHLPFASGQFDAVIFNASFHYAESYSDVVSEAVRCLKPGGMIIVADSPRYRKESSGEQMVAERRAAFLKRFGTESDSIHSREFLTDKRLKDLEKEFELRWQSHTPYYGLRWSMRPLLAHLRRRREPARFRIYTARTKV